MTLIQDAPIKEPLVRMPTVAVPPTVAPPVTGKRTWRKVVAGTAIGLAGVGVVAALGLGVMNTNDINSLQSDVTSLQTDLRTTQDQLSAVQRDLVLQRSGSSLAGEHLAQAPVTATGLDRAIEGSVLQAGKVAASQMRVGLPITG